MPKPDESIRKAIDEAIGPLTAEHRKYLANVSGPLLAVGRAELHYVFDQYANQLLDFSAEHMPVGHSHPYVHDTMREHLRYYLRTAPVGDHVLRWPVAYAKALAESFVETDDDELDLTPPQVLFTEGEREAVHLGVALARKYQSNRPRLAMIDTDTHNWLSSQVQGDIGLLPIDEFYLKDFQWDDYGTLLISPVTADGRVLDARWLQSVINYAKQYGLETVFDESRAGFGRLGTRWSQHALGVEADVTVLGGPLGAGMALGAVVSSKEHFAVFDADTSPQAGAPLACAAGAAQFDALNLGVVEHAKEAGGTLDDALTELVNQFPEYLVATHGQGLWRTLDFKAPELATYFETQARRHGLLVAAPVGSSLILTPTLICSEQELVRGVDLMTEVFLEWVENDVD